MEPVKFFIKALFCFVITGIVYQAKAQAPSFEFTSCFTVCQNPIPEGSTAYCVEATVENLGSTSGPFDFECDLDYYPGGGFGRVLGKICSVTISPGGTYALDFTVNSTDGSAISVPCGESYEIALKAYYSSCNACGSTSCSADLVTGCTNPDGPITVACCAPWSVNPSTQSVSSTGGTYNATVSSGGGCSYDLTFNESWLAFSSYGSGGLFNYTVAANTSCTSRTGTISINDYNDNINDVTTLTITQPGLSVTPSVSISANPSGAVCSGHTVTFTPNPTNGGNPSYEWYLNGSPVGSGSTYITSALTSNASVYCVMTSTANCASPTTATSNTVNITVSPSVTPSVSISANPSGAVCSGHTVTFTPNPTNGGSPSYEWYLNGSPVGSGSTYTTSALTSNSTVYCVMTSTANCVSPTTATSPTTSITVNPSVTPSISISANPSGAICSGNTVTFAPTPTNGGNPSYEWYLNGSPVGSGSTYTTVALTSNASVYCVMTSTANCPNPTSATSATTSVTVNQVSVSINPTTQTSCTGVQVSFPASGATTYSWSGQDVNGEATPTATATYNTSGTFPVTVTGTENGCSATASASVTIYTQPNTPITFNPVNPTGCGSVAVTASSSNCQGCSYNWSNNATTAQATITTNGTNSYTVTVSGGGNCSAIGTVSATVNTQPVVTSITPTNNNNGTYCQNQSLTLTANETGGTTYAWSGNGIVNNPTSATTTATPTSSTTYSVTVSDGNCSAIGSVNVTVTPAVTPSVTFSQLPASVCVDGQQSVTITASAVNGGTNPTYSWSSGCSGNPSNNTYSLTNISTACTVTCTITSNAECAISTTATATTNVQETTPLPASLRISIADTNICITDQGIFNTSPVNGGGSPSYTWYVNNQQVGSGSTLNYTFPSIGIYTVSCTMASSLACFSPASAQSNTLIINVTGQATPAVTISASALTICAGSPDTITAIPSTGGNNPTYQWSLNGGTVSGNNSAVFISSTLHNNDAVSCVMTSSSSCATTPTATSNTVTISVDSVVMPRVTIAANPSGTVCTSTQVTFTATSTNGGNPVYEWLVNGNYQSNNTNAFPDNSVNNNDVVSCVLISNAICATPDSVTSNTITETVDTAVTPSVNIVSNSGNSFCPGTGVTFTATPAHGGNAPSYQWYKNGNSIGTDSASFSTSIFNNSDVISCVLTSNAACATSNNATSNSITINISSFITPTVSIVANPTGPICPGKPITFTVTGTSGGGNSPTYQWQVRPNGGNVGTGGTTYIDSTLTSSETVVCLMTSSLTCANPAIATSNAIAPAFYPSPGNTITPPGTSTICPGDSIRLCAAAGNADYAWSTGASVQCIYVQFTGLYSVTATNVNLCTASASANLEDYSIPSTPDIKNISDSLYTDTLAASYQWYLNNHLVQGATNSGYLAVQNGAYYVVATDGNGCPGQSAIVTLTDVGVGIQELSSVSDFTITPNPSNGKFMIAFETGTPEDISIKVFDPLGRVIKTEDNVKVNGTYSKEIDLGNAASGIYIIQLVSGDKTLNRKLEINK